jgi:hypothetical protein
MQRFALSCSVLQCEARNEQATYVCCTVVRALSFATLARKHADRGKYRHHKRNTLTMQAASISSEFRAKDTRCNAIARLVQYNQTTFKP